MITHSIPQRGDVYWIGPNPIVSREMKDRHRFIIITPKEINTLGVAMAIPVTSGGAVARRNGLTVAITGYDTRGIVVCNQIRSFDIQARVKAGSARYIETLDAVLMDEIISRVISVIDPAD